MKVGDLVKIKYDGVVTLVTKVETVQFATSEYKNIWVHLLGQSVPFKAGNLEIINASR